MSELFDHLYILDEEGHPQPCPDLDRWAAWRADHPTKHVAADMDETAAGRPIRISTVFLGVDHRMPFDDGPPLLWETMVFGGPLDMEQERYSSRDEALRGHQRMCQRVRTAIESAPEGAQKGAQS